jgi:hypothetical protein
MLTPLYYQLLEDPETGMTLTPSDFVYDESTILI